MIFVNTSLETAQERNKMRKRTLPEKQVETMWNGVQQNMGKFQRLFGASNMIIVDNNDAGEDVFNKVWKRMCYADSAKSIEILSQNGGFHKNWPRKNANYFQKNDKSDFTGAFFMLFFIKGLDIPVLF